MCAFLGIRWKNVQSTVGYTERYDWMRMWVNRPNACKDEKMWVKQVFKVLKGELILMERT